MLKIQEYLSCFEDQSKGLEYLKQNLNIVTTSQVVMEEDKVLDVSVLAPGNHADMNDPLVKEAHCLFLDKDGELLAKAWDHPDIIPSLKDLPKDFDFNSFFISEEVPDGKIVVIYNIDGTWTIGTEDYPDGMDYLPGMSFPGFTYEHEIKSLLAQRFAGRWDKPLQTINPMMCLVCIYTDPFAKTITPASHKNLYLMGIVNLETGKEMSVAAVEGLASRLKLDRPRWNDIYGVHSLQSKFKMLPTLCPGIMLRDKEGKRVFMPNSIYTTVKAAVDAGDRVVPLHIAKILQACRNKADTIIIGNVYRQFKPMLYFLWQARYNLWKELLDLWNSSHTHDIKEFAKRIHKHPLNYLLFMYRRNQIHSIEAGIDSLKPDKLVYSVKTQWSTEFENKEKSLTAGGSFNGDEESDGEEGTEIWGF